MPHSSGSSRSWASRQTLKTRTPGPSVSTCTIPGTSRSCRAPSAITRTSGSLNIALPMEEPSTRRRAWIWATSSEIRLAVDSGSLPTATTGPAPPPDGRRWGSHRTQAQPSARERSERTTTRRSRGLCRTADWATSQRASAWTEPSVPATPTTPNSATSMPIGTSGMLQRTRRWFSSRAGSSISFTDGWSTVPIRSTRWSGSCRRRSQSRPPGPVAVSATVAGSGPATPRTRRSRSAAVRTSCSSTRRRAS